MEGFTNPDPSRIGHLLNRLGTEGLDIIFLQEAEVQTLKEISKNPTLLHYQRIYKAEGAEAAGGLLILVKPTFSLSSKRYIELPSDMGRGLLLSTVTICGKPVTLVDLHLESPDLLLWRSNALRLKQVESLKSAIAGKEDFIIAGDWNFVFDENAEKTIPSDWLDAWIFSHPKERGLTWDPKTNQRAWWAGGFMLSGYRLDRFLIKSLTLKVGEVDLFGEENPKKLSDHYGVHLSLECTE